MRTPTSFSQQRMRGICAWCKPNLEFALTAGFERHGRLLGRTAVPPNSEQPICRAHRGAPGRWAGSGSDPAGPRTWDEGSRPGQSGPQEPALRSKRLATILLCLTGLFLLRVLSQVMAALDLVDWLPAFEQWQSGLLPYPALLASQIAILTLMGTIVWQIWRGQGVLASPRSRLARWLRRLTNLYAGSMVVRYAVTMALMPEWRWIGHSIPTLFHLVLASALFVYSLALSGADRSK